MKRGDVFLVNFDPTVGAEARKTRPALGVSNDINNAHSPIVSITPGGLDRPPCSPFEYQGLWP
ncbi:MAG: type II toxin-antitoxin system PemK/MazF family toxin [Deltaproteobacteria bacterium]|nr:type II toxin-antitoxin system PemK/MazF family toxin [Deltaproteobacteria bacterium]